MVLGHNGKINRIMVGQILHVMAVPGGTIMTLSGMTHLRPAVIMKRKRAAYQKYYFAITLMRMQSA